MGFHIYRAEEALQGSWTGRGDDVGVSWDLASYRDVQYVRYLVRWIEDRRASGRAQVRLWMCGWFHVLLGWLVGK